MGSFQENLTLIQEKIAAAAHRSSRSREDIHLVAVSKMVPWARVHEAAAAGQRLMGENYMQEAQEKIMLARSSEEGRKLIWHFIGHLQSNKAGMAVELFDVIESLDRLKLALALDRHATTSHKAQKVLVQVNIGREPQKSGVLPEECEDLLLALQQQCPHLKVLGLMAMPPMAADPEASRPYFRAMREMADNLAGKGLIGGQGRAELSMGMSGDFEVAIEEGATLVRVGTALFGCRVE